MSDADDYADMQMAGVPEGHASYVLVKLHIPSAAYEIPPGANVIRGAHELAAAQQHKVCRTCGTDWPCKTIVAVAALQDELHDAFQVEADLRAQVAEWQQKAADWKTYRMADTDHIGFRVVSPDGLVNRDELRNALVDALRESDGMQHADPSDYRHADAIMPLIDQAVAETETRMREHYRPALRALAWWAEERRVGTHNWLTWNGLSTDLADECIAAAEAET